MSETNIIKKEDPDKRRENKKESWIKSIYKFVRNSFFIRHFLCIFVFILLIIYLYLSYKKDIRTYFFLSNLKVILPALIAAAGVFEGFNINRKKSFKEIVTKERIDWLHRLQNNLSEYLKLTNSIMKKDVEKIVNEKEKEKAKLLIEEKKDKINKLYYEIIFNINHQEHKKALDAIKSYNDYIFGRELEKDIKIKKKIIEIESQDTHELKKFKCYVYINNFEKLRSEVETNFTEIFKEVWEDIKEEAD